MTMIPPATRVKYGSALRSLVSTPWRARASDTVRTISSRAIPRP